MENLDNKSLAKKIWINYIENFDNIFLYSEF